MKNFSLRILLHIAVLTGSVLFMQWSYLHQRWASLSICFLLLIATGASLYNMQIRTLKALRELIKRVRFMEQRETVILPFRNKLTEEISHELCETMDFFRHQLQDEATRQQYYERLLDEVDTAVIVCNADGHTEWMNRAARLQPALSGNVPKDWLRHSSQHTRLVTLSHQQTPYEMALSCTHFGTRQGIHYLLSLKNIHEVLEQTQLDAWQKLIRILTHEIMNSITPILSLSETLSQREIPDHPSLKEYRLMHQAMETIHRRSKGLLDFTENYRRLTRIPQPQPVDILVDELFNDLNRLFDVPYIEFVQPYWDVTLYADRPQTEQVLINLLKNACEACDNPHPRIRVALELLPDGTRKISVTDNGKGILPEAADRIFLPFYTTKPSGSGIGLSLCKQILHLHHGNITVKSEPGKGSCFILRFPPHPQDRSNAGIQA